MRALPISRTARRRFHLDPAEVTAPPATPRLAADVVAARRVAAAVNAARKPGEPSAQAGELAALELLHEIFHLVVARAAELVPDSSMPATTTEIEGALGRKPVVGLLDAVAGEFPDVDGRPAPARLEELLLLRVANENPAARPLRDLVDDTPLIEPGRDTAMRAVERYQAALPPVGRNGETLVELLRAPARAHPTSLAGQLAYVRDQWAELLGDALQDLLARMLVAIDVIAQEERGLHQRFGGGGDGGPGAFGRAEAPDLEGLEAEPERFSSDSAWMPRLVLIAKSTHVWLDQLSRRHGRDIRTLDAIPDEELDRLARWGITGLWLIGLWERSKASQRIKVWRGNPDAAASAYSLDDYVIAGDLGGEAAWADLRHRAWQRGVRLASDMVPNHMGIDSRWVMDHPEWFLSTPDVPYPAYTYGGENLAEHDRVEIRLEDHYWNNPYSAVVFERRDRSTGERRYVYHGNDGTSFPWNDTAQLDFSQAVVREQVIQAILDVARRFPVIRFDAAMVLARRHVRRLWFPAPGSGGEAIPSRAEFGTMTDAEFDAAMPDEFWRDVVDRVAREVPDTLLLAEAFWMLEGYFVRTLGMHRVYNSAVMHMLRDEDGKGYRKVIRETIVFDPEILKRYVNFMSNPDEKTAIEQFGKGDKYFGVATVLATLPGLPMLGHGQVQGFGEKYGMEFRRAMVAEEADPWLIERHEREIFPLLHRRSWFAGSADFLLYDFVTADGVDDGVLAYSNGSGPQRSLVLYHTRFASTAGRIHRSARYAVKAADGSKRTVRRTLADGLGLPNDPAMFVTFRDGRSGLEYVRSCAAIREHGLDFSLDAYGSHVFWEFHEVHDGVSGQWARLAARLDGTGVPSLAESMRLTQLEPVHAPLRAIFAAPEAADLVAGRASAGSAVAFTDAIEALYVAIADATNVPPDAAHELAAATAADAVTAMAARE